MTTAERDQFRDKVRDWIAGGNDGLEIDTEFRWVVTGVERPEPFFQNLSLLLTPDAVLHFEGCSVSRDVCAFYEANEASSIEAVMRDTIFPVSECFHVRFSDEVLTKVCEWVASRPVKELFDHVKAYRGKELLLHFHDAFDKSCLLISDRVAEHAVAEFSGRLGASYHREPNVNKRIEGLRALLKVLENPSKIRIPGESWWSRLWRRLTRR